MDKVQLEGVSIFVSFDDAWTAIGSECGPVASTTSSRNSDVVHQHRARYRKHLKGDKNGATARSLVNF